MTSSGPVRPDRRRGPGAGRLALAVLLLLPVVEIAAVIAVADRIGAGWTFLALLAKSMVGMALLGRTGRAARAALDRQTDGGPADAGGGPVTGTVVGGPRDVAVATDLTLRTVGAVLLVMPGVLTGVVGLLLTVPLVRRALRPLLGAGAARLVESVARRSRFQVVPGETAESGTDDPPQTDRPMIRGEVVGDAQKPPKPAPPA